MAGFLGRSAPDDGDVLDYRGRKRIALVVPGSGDSAAGQDRGGYRSLRGRSGNLRDDGLRPRGGGILVIDIAVDPVADPPRAQFL